MNKLIMLSLALMLGASSLAKAVSPSSVTLEYDTPDNIMAGEVVTTTIRLTANQNLSSLTASASAYSGLELISGGNNLVFRNLKRGDSREFEVTIHLDNDLGYLAMETTSIDTTSRKRYNSQAIRFGSPSKTTRARMKSQNIIVDSSGQTLLLMQAEVN